MQNETTTSSVCQLTRPTCLTLTLPVILCMAAIVSAAEQKRDEYKFQWRIPDDKTHVLWIGGGHWHDTLQTTAILRRVLESTGRYHVTYTEDTSVLTRLDRYNVIVLNGMLDSLEPEEEQSLLDTIRGGKPMLVLHAASACFRKPPPAKGVSPPADHPEFYKMLGGYVRRHPPFGPVSVRVTDAEHAITRGLNDFVIEDELFLFQNLEPDNKVLLEADYEGERCPVAWTRQWGDARVFHLALGHNDKAANHESFQRLIAQGLDWLTGTNTKDEIHAR